MGFDYMYVCMYIMCVPGAQGSQKQVSDSLELEFQMVVNWHVGIESQTFVSWKSTQNSLTIEPFLQAPAFISYGS